MVTDVQVRKLMKELVKGSGISVAAARSGMDEKTARKYRDSGKLPSEMKKRRHWRTRIDAFEEDWTRLEEMLRDAPELEAKTLFEVVCENEPGKYQEGQLRSLQRKVRRWRALQGPPKEVFFAQEHRAGEAMQTDFTHLKELGVTICGEPLVHLLCHSVLPHSNWEWGTLCLSESFAALRRGVQAAVFKLGQCPQYHQTDHSTAATHRIGTNVGHSSEGAADLDAHGAQRRKFNADYLGLMTHLGMEPRTIAVGKSNQNGDVESSHNVLKRRLRQHLLLRGSRDFPSLQSFEQWLQGVMSKANALRTNRLEQDIAAMKPLGVAPLPEFREERPKVTTWSTIRVDNNAYSVPSRLIGEHVRVRVYEDHIEVRFAEVEQLCCARLVGQGHNRIDYRHIIWSLVLKPGAFERYKYRDALFPSVVFRQAYDKLLASSLSVREADLHYLRILHLSASTMQSDVELALILLHEQGHLPTIEEVKDIVKPEAPVVPELAELAVDLRQYDALLSNANSFVTKEVRQSC